MVVVAGELEQASMRSSTVAELRQGSVRQFCWFVTDPAYGWAGECEGSSAPTRCRSATTKRYPAMSPRSRPLTCRFVECRNPRSRQAIASRCITERLDRPCLSPVKSMALTPRIS
jgi:hypothetical protein